MPISELALKALIDNTNDAFVGTLKTKLNVCGVGI